MNEDLKYHAIKVNPEKCFGCTYCLKACPTEAIRIKNGKAVINSKRCVDCGNCLRVCPVQAFFIEHDNFEQIKQYKYRVVLFPSVMIGQFPEKYSEGAIYEALLKIGFTHIFEVEQPINILVDVLKKRVLASENKPAISSFCPAIVRLIQSKYPALVEHILPVKEPHDLAANYAINKLSEKGIPREETGIFYVSPCSAKIAAIKRPPGEKQSVVDGLINMDELYNRIMKSISEKENINTSEYRSLLSRDGIIWSLPRGEARHFNTKSMAIDGIHNVVKFLERIENGHVPKLDFLELKSCIQGCAGGILLTGNRYLTAERLQKRSKRYPLASKQTVPIQTKEKLSQAIKADKILPNYVFALDSNREKALEKFRKIDKILCQLPGVDCGGCGAPNCYALAEDMVQGKAKMSDCVFLQKRYLKENRITVEKACRNVEKIWGVKRFDADCNIKGRRNEGF